VIFVGIVLLWIVRYATDTHRLRDKDIYPTLEVGKFILFF